MLQLATDPEGVLSRHRGEVYRWAYRLLGRHDDAADVTQDVCLRWLLRSKVDPPASAEPWLRRVTINRAIDLIRARRTQQAGLAAASPVADAPAAGAGLEQDEVRLAVARALETLSDMQRCVLVAKVLDGRTFAQIAAEHGIAIPTAKTHYLRALAGVRDALSTQPIMTD